MRAMAVVMSITGDAYCNRVLELTKTDEQSLPAPPLTQIHRQTQTCKYKHTQASGILQPHHSKTVIHLTFFSSTPHTTRRCLGTAQDRLVRHEAPTSNRRRGLLLERKCCDPGPKSLCASWSCFSRSSMDP